MSDNVRDELKKLLLHAYLLGGMDREKDYKGINVDSIASNFCEDVITLFRKEGYMHPDDLVEGSEGCTAGAINSDGCHKAGLPLGSTDCSKCPAWKKKTLREHIARNTVKA